MKKLLLLFLIAPIIGNSQIGNIFPTEIAEILLPLWKKPDGKIDTNQFIKDNETLLYAAFLEKGKKKNQQLNKKIFNKKKLDT